MDHTGLPAESYPGSGHTSGDKDGLKAGLLGARGVSFAGAAAAADARKSSILMRPSGSLFSSASAASGDNAEKAGSP